MSADPLAEIRASAEDDRSVRSLRDANRRLTAEAEELRSLIAFYGSARSEPIKIPTWTTKPRSSAHAGLVVAQLTDTHFDEVVKPEEVFGLNAYNRDIAMKRLKRWAERVVSLPRDYMKGVRLEGLVVPATGDIFTGDIHPELKNTNESPLLASVLDWQEPMMAAFDLFEREYGRVVVHAVVGNHGRLSVKPIFKGRVYDNVEWLFWSVIRDRLKDRKSKVTVNVSPAMDLDVTLYGRHHLITHGDQFHGGAGISGAMAPLMLGSHRKGVRQQAAGMPMSLMVMGHFHQVLDLPGVIVGGSMKGYDEYAFGLNLRPEPARQMLWLTTPERGKTLAMPVELQDRASEGW